MLICVRRRWFAPVKYLVLVSLFGVACSYSASISDSTVVPQQSSIFILETQGCSERRTGTATLVNVGGERRVLTNRHLVDDTFAGSVDGVELAWSETKLSPTVDMAEVELGVDSMSDAEELELADEPPSVGDVVGLVGYREGTRLAIVKAEVQVFSDGEPYGYRGEVMLLSEPTVQGFSGGPVLDADGEVVGLLMAVDQSTDLTVAIPLSTLQQGATYSSMKPLAHICKL